MTEREFLDERTARVKARLELRSEAVRQQLERAVGPVVRDHPRKSLAAAGVVGVALGAALKPASPTARGTGAGAFRFLKRTVAYALQAKLVGSMTSDGDGENEDGAA